MSKFENSSYPIKHAPKSAYRVARIFQSEKALRKYQSTEIKFQSPKHTFVHALLNDWNETKYKMYLKYSFTNWEDHGIPLLESLSRN